MIYYLLIGYREWGFLIIESKTSFQCIMTDQYFCSVFLEEKDCKLYIKSEFSSMLPFTMKRKFHIVFHIVTYSQSVPVCKVRKVVQGPRTTRGPSSPF